MKTTLFIIISFTLGLSSVALARPMKIVTDKEVVDAYQYLMARILVLRQEQIDFDENGMKWNELAHRKVGGAEWTNPNLDVAYSEAWVAIDNNSCTIVEVPEIKDRYYTVQVLNGWGETTANINNRTYAKNPFGKFALCLKDAKVSLPEKAVRITIPSKKSRVLTRVEIGKDTKTAETLQHQFKMYTTGTPVISEAPTVPEFTYRTPPGGEIFENGAAIMASEKDLNPGMGGLQRKVLAVQSAIKNKNTRAATEKSVQEKAIPAFLTLRSKVLDYKNGWGYPQRVGNYGSDYLSRAFVNYAGIWANNSGEAIYVSCAIDSQKNELNGTHSYTMTFEKDNMPEKVVKYFWSITAIDNQDYKAIPNAAAKHSLSSATDFKKNTDGSLTLYFGSKLPQGVPEQNWLPAQAGKPFHLTFRFYGPKEEVIKYKYKLPPLVKKDFLASNEVIQ